MARSVNLVDGLYTVVLQPNVSVVFCDRRRRSEISNDIDLSSTQNRSLRVAIVRVFVVSLSQRRDVNTRCILRTQNVTASTAQPPPDNCLQRPGC